MTEPGTGQVECYSGHTYAQEPRALVWRGRRYQVTRVEERWQTPEGPAFRVLTEPGGLYEIRYRELDRQWAIRAVPDAETSPSPFGD